jgi:hypothetical protein
VRLVRRLRQDHLFAVEARLLGVDQPVEGRVLLAGDALAGVEDGVEGLARVIGETRARVQAVGVQPVVEEEIDRGAEGGHGDSGDIAGVRRRLTTSLRVRSP